MPDSLTPDDIGKMHARATDVLGRQTHYDGCWEHHPWCAVARLLPLAEQALSGERSEQWGVRFPQGGVASRVNRDHALRSARHNSKVVAVRRTFITGPWEPVEGSTDG